MVFFCTHVWSVAFSFFFVLRRAQMCREASSSASSRHLSSIGSYFISNISLALPLPLPNSLSLSHSGVFFCVRLSSAAADADATAAPASFSCPALPRLALPVRARPPHNKVGGVKCYPPLSDNRLIFFTHKALLVDLQRHKNWHSARDSSLREVSHLPAAAGEADRRFTPRRWPPLIRSHRTPSPLPPSAAAAAAMMMTTTSPDFASAAASPMVDHAAGGLRRRRSGGGFGGEGGRGHGSGSVVAEGGGQQPQQLTRRSTPRGYQEELFWAVMGSERNSMVYLPTGLGKTLVACMVLRRLLYLNPGRQAYFLVETTALAMQQVFFFFWCV